MRKKPLALGPGRELARWKYLVHCLDHSFSPLVLCLFIHTGFQHHLDQTMDCEGPVLLIPINERVAQESSNSFIQKSAILTQERKMWSQFFCPFHNQLFRNGIGSQKCKQTQQVYSS